MERNTREYEENYVLDEYPDEPHELLNGPKTPYKGFTMRAVDAADGKAKVVLYRDGNVQREFLYPAYKVWNLAAHFEEIVESELAEKLDGYEAAGWSGFDVFVIPEPTSTDEVAK